MAAESAGVLSAMCRVDEVKPTPTSRPAGTLAFAMEGEEVLLDLAGAVDPAAERARLEAKATTLEGSINGLNGRLSNASYVEKAPPHLVEETRTQLEQAQGDLAATKTALEAIG
jgi:valyl-tRNA synthetase